jgi:hypothetical protein
MLIVWIVLNLFAVLFALWYVRKFLREGNRSLALAYGIAAVGFVVVSFAFVWFVW